MSRTNRDRKLLEEAEGVLARMPCQFWACEGPTLRPIDMVTCYRCDMLARISKRLNNYIPRKERQGEHEKGAFPKMKGWN